MHRNTLIISSFLLLLIIGLASFTHKEEEPVVWKNVQILPSTITRAQMDEVMDAWSASLGVNCSHCHTRGNYAADDKDEKIIARKMLVMTNEINEKYFGKDSGTIGCMTCHNGKLHP